MSEGIPENHNILGTGNRLVREVVHQYIARLQQSTGAAGTVILKLMADPSVPAAVRLRPAEGVFDRVIKEVEPEDIEARVLRPFFP